ncbi:MULTISPECIES: phage tail protein [unclassified Haematobacter]|uniref:phage tail protein n=1 Tax=unclassified Haematobacter TaxID=2640585 RepID=UPI0025BABAFE|nr:MULTISPECIES: phage tail protein [unclassified Haematobacter]
MRRLLLATTLLAGLWAAPAAADPVSFALLANGASFWSAFGATIGSVALRLGAVVGASLLSQKLAARKAVGSGGVKLQTTVGGITPQTFVMGRYATAGQLAAPLMTGATTPGHTPNPVLFYIMALGCRPGQTVRRVIINDDYAELGEEMINRAGLGEVLPVLGKYSDAAFLRHYDGSQTVVDPVLSQHFGTAANRPWGSDRIGHGIPYAVAMFKFDARVWSGQPSIRFEVDGAPLYDPRFDSTMGGSGPQRWSDQATWAQTANLAVMIYNLLRGIRLPDGNIYGGSAAAEDLPLANWFAAMNACDALVDLEAGGSEPAYHGGTEVSVDEDPADVIERLLAGCDGQLVEAGGVWRIRIGPPALPVLFLTETDDILVTSAQTLDQFPGDADLYNGIQAAYVDPAALWAEKDAPPRYNAAWEAEDGQRRVAELQLPVVTSATQAQRLMEANLADNRRFRVINITLGPYASMLEPLDSIAWTSGVEGYTGKVFEVTRVDEDLGTATVTITARERDQSDYNWSPSQELPVIPSDPGTGPVVVQAVPGWTVAAITYRDSAGRARRPAIQMGWTPEGAVDAKGIHWEIHMVGTAEIISGPLVAMEAGGAIVMDGILPNATYEVRARIEADRQTMWTSPVTVTTPDVRLSELDITYGEGVVEEVNEFVDGYTQWLKDSTRDLLESTRRNVFRDIDADTAAYTARQKIRREVTQTAEGVTASYREEITAATGPGSALAQQLTELNATVAGKASATALNALTTRVTTAEGDIDATAQALTDLAVVVNGKASSTAVSALQTQVTQQGSDITANANAITALDVAVGRMSASALFRAYTVANAGGSLSRIALQAAASSGEANSARSAAIFLEAMSGGLSRVAIVADQFVVINGSAREAPFIVENGVLKAKALLVDELVVRGNIVTGAVTQATTISASTPLALSDNDVALQLDLGTVPEDETLTAQTNFVWTGNNTRLSLNWWFLEDGLWLLGDTVDSFGGKSGARTGFMTLLIPGGGQRRVMLTAKSNGISITTRRLTVKVPKR